MAKARGLTLIHLDPRKPLPKPGLVTEDSAALLFADEYRGKLRYCHDTGSWFEWRDTVWRKNRTGLAFEWARALVRDISSDASDKVKANVAKSTFAIGVERYCRSDPTFAVTIEAWDGDPFLIGTAARMHRERKAQFDKKRPASSQRGYDREWNDAARAFLARPENRFCTCGAPAVLVRHRRSIRTAPHLRMVEANWLPGCRRCNALDAVNERRNQKGTRQ